ncbi:hypothetical protein [Mesorhizobium helmanticense]|uniref:hypothetical protein n=1 Tax=Mesorhizobium helmanticense TaxID=1776423 RepID=UPI001FE0B42B|nr:hypothetical protein [Mesorhizobium helmanticense]
MLGVKGKIQREGEVVHLVARQLSDLSADLASVGDRENAFPLPHGRGDQIRDGSFGTRPARAAAAGPQAAQHPRPLWPYQSDQGEGAEFPVNCVHDSVKPIATLLGKI